MRLVDLLIPYLPALQRCVVVVNGSLDVTSYITVRDAVDVFTVTREGVKRETLTPQTAVVTTAGPDPDHGQLADAFDVLRALPDATLVFLVLGWAPQELPVNHLVSALDRSGLQLLQVAGLGYTRLSSALVAVRTTEALAFRDLQGRGGDDAFPRLPATAATRLINEHLLLDATTRQLKRLTVAGEAAVPAESVERARTQALRQENVRLAQELHTTKNAAQSLERKVSRLESSTSLRLGRALVSAAREPARGARALPREALHMWRSRGQAVAARTAATPRSSYGSIPEHDLTGDREFLRWSTTAVRPHRRTTVAGAVTTRTERLLSGSTCLSSVLPHTAAEIVRRTQPDFFLVETAAAELHSAWSYLGEPGAPERDRDLLAAVRACQSIGVPVVLWRNGPFWRTPGLHWLVEECDLLLEGPEAANRQGTLWSPGVHLEAATDLSHDDKRAGVLYAGSWPVRERAARREHLRVALQSAVPHGLTILNRSEQEMSLWPEELRTHLRSCHSHVQEQRFLRSRAVSIEPIPRTQERALPSTTSLEHLAAGLRLVGSVDHLSCSATVLLREQNRAPEVIAEAVRLGALRPNEHLEVLRILFLAHGTGAAVAQLLSLLGSSDLDPGLDRAVVVEARVDDARDAERLAAALSSQRWRPKRLQIVASTDLTRFLDEVTDSGISVALVSADDHRQESSFDEGWRILWDGQPWPANYLLDLALWGEVTGADAVEPPRHDPQLAGASAGCLLRTAALERYGYPGRLLQSWTNRGAQIVVSPDPGEEL